LKIDYVNIVVIVKLCSYYRVFWTLVTVNKVDRYTTICQN